MQSFSRIRCRSLAGRHTLSTPAPTLTSTMYLDTHSTQAFTLEEDQTQYTGRSRPLYQKRSSRCRSLEDLHSHHCQLEVPKLVKTVNENQRKYSLQPQTTKSVSVTYKHSTLGVESESPARRVSVLSQLSDLIMNSRSNSRGSNGALVRRRRRTVISYLNLCCIRSVLIVTIVIFIIVIFKFYNYLQTGKS